MRYLFHIVSAWDPVIRYVRMYYSYEYLLYDTKNNEIGQARAYQMLRTHKIFGFSSKRQSMASRVVKRMRTLLWCQMVSFKSEGQSNT